MMEFDYKNAKVKVTFRYDGNLTTCWMAVRLGASEWWFGGHALCVDKQFVKEKGRKIALRRALENSKADKEFRTEVWTRYHLRGFTPLDLENALLINTFVPEAEFLSYEDAVSLAKQRMNGVQYA